MKRKSLITLILGTALAVAPAAHAMVLSDGGSSNTSPAVTSMSQPEYQALMARSEALNQKYGLGTSQASRVGISKAEYRALILRSEALNQQYGLGSSATVTDGWTNSVTTSYSFRPDILGGNGGVSVQPTATGGDSFEWGTVGIGAATLIGVMLLGAASLAVTRRRHQPSF
jgi:hypothetical protein